MKVKVISRSTDEFTRERSQDLQVFSIPPLFLMPIFLILRWGQIDILGVFSQRVFRNFDPTLRTQEKAVEYVRALNAAKLDKVALSSDIWV